MRTFPTRAPRSLDDTRPLRIGLVAPPVVPLPPPTYAGTERIVSSLALGLHTRGHEVTVFHVLHRDELELPFEGMTRFDGLEEARHLVTQPHMIRPTYQRVLRAFLDELRLGCEAIRADYVLLDTSRPLGPVLGTYLAQRLRVRERLPQVDLDAGAAFVTLDACLTQPARHRPEAAQLHGRALALAIAERGRVARLLVGGGGAGGQRRAGQEDECGDGSYGFHGTSGRG